MDTKQRIIRNVIMGVIILAMGASMFFTIHAKTSQAPQGGPPGSQSMQSGEMPSQQSGDQSSDSSQNSDGASKNSDGAQNGDSSSQNSDGAQSSDTSQSSDTAQSGQMQAPPEKPEGDSQGAPPSNSSENSGQAPSGNGGNGDAPQGQPPAGDPPSGDPSSGQPPQGDNSSDSNASGGAPDGSMQAPPDMNHTSMGAGTYALLGGEALIMALAIAYLILSKGNTLTFGQTLRGSKRKIALAAIAVVLAGGITAADVALANNSAQQGPPTQTEQQDQNSVSAKGVKTVDGTTEELDGTYDSTEEDTSSILVTNGGSMTLDGASVTKTGDSTSTEASEFSGVNAGILTQEGSTSVIKNSTITTDASGSNAIFSTGTDAKVYVSDTTITTTGERSARGLDATYGGYIEADNVKITTSGGSCASLATDRGEGTVKVTDSTLKTAGAGSPLIYSTGDISVTNTTGEATGAQITCIEGKNSATITNSKLACSGAGNRGDVDQCGVFIYQSMSGDASEGTGTFTATDSTLTISEDSEQYKTAPMFLVTNTDAVINLTNTELDFGSGVLLNVTATDEWGQSGSNGGDAEFTAKDQTLTGDISVDDISTLDLDLEDGSYFEGSINSENTAKEVTLKLSSDSKIKLTGDTYVTSLEDEDEDYSNIDLNGYKLYVNGHAVNC